MFDIEMKRNTILENGVGIFSFVYGPSSLDHLFEDHYVKIEDSLVVGQSTEFDCTANVIDKSSSNFRLSGLGRAWRVGTNGKIGISTATFSSGDNAAPDEPFNTCMDYQSLGGRMEVKGMSNTLPIGDYF